MGKIFIIILFSFFISSCKTARDKDEQVITYDKKVEQLEKFNFFGGIFSGELPCADCPGIKLTFLLKGDSTFFMETTYLEAEKGIDKNYYDWGRWSIDSLNRISLAGTDRDNNLFKIVNGDTIRMLDKNGEEIASPFNYDLSKKENSFDTEISVKLTGYYSYVADAGIFTECLTGKTFFVAQKENNATVEREYLNIRQKPNEKVFLTAEGYFTSQKKIDGDGYEDAIIFTKFLNISRDGECK